MAMVFCRQNNNRKVNEISQKSELGKKYVFLAKCIENSVLTEKYSQQNRGKKIKDKNGGNHTQAITATLFRDLNEQGYKFFMITTGISSQVHYLLEEKGVWFLS